jgi:hypothetical protein
MAKFIKGHIQSEEVKRKIGLKNSINSLGNTSHLGYKHSQEAREKMSMALKGRKLSVETKKRMLGRTPWNKGIKLGPLSESVLLKLKGRTPWNKGLKRPEMSGDKHPLWINDRKLVKTYIDRREDSLYKQWRISVYTRDNYKCRIDSIDCDGRIEAHHILGWTAYPELRYEINNGITLCHAHHPFKKEEEKRLAPIFQELIKK